MFIQIKYNNSLIESLLLHIFLEYIKGKICETHKNAIRLLGVQK